MDRSVGPMATRSSFATKGFFVARTSLTYGSSLSRREAGAEALLVGQRLLHDHVVAHPQVGHAVEPGPGQLGHHQRALADDLLRIAQ